MKRDRLIGFIIAGFLTGAAVASYFLIPRSPTGTSTEVTTGTALVGGPFQLTNHNGQRVTEKDFLGKVSVVFFGFTSCPDICPAALQVLTSALNQLGPKAEQVAPLFITIDAENDTPEKIAAYLKAFSPQIVGLTGTADELAATAKVYRAFVQKVDDENKPGSYTFDHSSVFYIMGKDGKFVTHAGNTNDVNELVSLVQKAL